MSGSLFDGIAPEPKPAPVRRRGGWFTAHCDGGSRGNPGPAGFGAVIEDPRGRVVARLSEYLGKQTNNYAEYSGLLAVLKWAASSGVPTPPGRLRFRADGQADERAIQGLESRPSSPVGGSPAPGPKPGRLRHHPHPARRQRRGRPPGQRGHGSGNGEKQGTRGSRDRADKKIRTQATTRRLPSLQAAPPAKPERQVLEGYVKDGVVHLLEGELPDGIFVKVVRE